MRFGLRLPAVCSALVLVSACSGGGGGGGVGTTPAPSPSPSSPTPTPTTANSSLLDLTATESFTNDAASSGGSFYADARACRCAAASAAVNIRYDAGTRGYTVSVDGRSQTFSPSDLDTAQSNATIQVFTKRAGALTESLTLTRPGNSGALTYKYVGGGYWQRANTVGDRVDATFDAFSYGVETPDAAVPRSGTALYGIDIIGTLGWGAPVVLSGSGTLMVDLAKGTIIASGKIEQVSLEGHSFGKAPFIGKGQLSSSSNLFNGTFSFDASLAVMSGTMSGRFYGPGAEELGAVFATTNADGRAAVGTITGRRDGATGGDTSFDSLTRNQFMANDSAYLRATFVGSVPTGESAGTEPVTVYYDRASNSYTLTTSDRTFVSGPGYMNPGDSFEVPSTSERRYVRGGLWIDDRGRGDYSFNALTFGFETPASATPRTGTGYYPVALIGKLTDPTQNSGALDLSGAGMFTANFANGQIDVSGGVQANYRPLSGAPAPVTGTFSGSGTITSGSNRFGGGFTVDVLGQHVGNFAGRFYGPAGEEIGATFYGTAPGGNVVTGMLLGTLDPAIATARPLASLTAQTVFSPAASQLRYGIIPLRGVFHLRNNASAGRDSPQLTWNPTTGSYLVEQLLNMHETGRLSIGFGAADRNAAGDSAGFAAYRRVEADQTIDARVYNSATGPVALTYTSFATLLVSSTYNIDTAMSERTYLPFGVRTPAGGMPRTGSAVYNGVVFGDGIITGLNPSFYSLSGTSRLDVNFLTGFLSGRLDVMGTNKNGGGNRDFGSLRYDSIQIGRDGQFFGGLSGYFFGPRAEEFGAVFTHKQTEGDGERVLSGVTVGKKAP